MMPELLGKSALLVDPWKIDNIALSIKEAVCNIGVRDRLVRAGLENVKRFSWEKAAQETINILTE